MKQKQNFRERILSRWARWSVENWGKALLIALAITVILGFGMARLKMEMTFYSMLPDRSNQVRDLKEIVENFSYASAILVVIDGRSIDDPIEAEQTVKDTIDAITLEYKNDVYNPYIASESTIPVLLIARIIEGIKEAKPKTVVRVVIRRAVPVLAITRSILPFPSLRYL